MNLSSLYEDGLRKYGEYPSCFFEGKWYTNVELFQMSNKLGNALKALGIARGDRVVTQLPNCTEIFVTFNAVYRIGAVMVPMTPILKPEQISYIYKDSGAKAVITSSDYLPWIRIAQQEAPDLKHIILIDKGGIQGTFYLPELLAENSSELAAADTDNDDLAALIYTSGTTGNPKGVMHTHFSLYINAVAFTEFTMLSSPVTLSSKERLLDEKSYKIIEMQQEVTGLNRSILFLAVLPLSHSYGLSFMNFGSLVGGKSVLLKWWNPIEALKSIQNHRIGYIAFVPTMYVQLLDHPDFDKYDLSSLRYCVSGGAALDPSIGRRWKEKTGIHIHEGWGLTESGATTAANPFPRPPKYGSIGVNMLRCNTMKVFDYDDKELPPGQTGEIVIKGPAVMKGYWNLPDETAKTLIKGWLHTGDVGHVDEDGYFFITDRKKDLIIRGGENVSPGEVEEVICKHPKVVDAACVGMKDRVYGEEIKAFVVLKYPEKCSEAEIIEFCQQKLPKFKTPKKVQFVETLPRNLLGKLLRAELRNME